MFFRIKLGNEGFFAETEMCSGSPRAQSVEQETVCQIFSLQVLSVSASPFLDTGPI